MPPSPRRRPTLIDVARLAGVSHMTVSRVVRGDHVVAPLTVRKVRRAIEKLDYRPDPALSALAAYRSRTKRATGSVLAFLDCDGDAYSDLVREGARGEAERLGYGLVSHRMPPDEADQRRLSRQLYHRGIRGLLFGPSDRSWTFTGWDWRNFAAVSLGALTHQPAMSTVAMDYFEGAGRAYDFLREKGCRRIALVVRPRLEQRTAHRWMGGYASRTPETLHIFQESTFSEAAIKRWLGKRKIDGLLTIHLEAWRAAKADGIPLVFLNEFECPPGVPHLTYDAPRIGIEGVRLIHHQLLNHEFGLTPECKTVSLQAAFRLA